MKWMRERDLLIAQTMAFVQSVSGKKLAADNTFCDHDCAHTIAHESRVQATALSKALPGASLLQRSRADARHRGLRRERRRCEPHGETGPTARPDLRDEFQSEIKARVANFRAHQERFSREREAYCSATMAKVHASIKESELPPRLGN